MKRCTGKEDQKESRTGLKPLMEPRQREAAFLLTDEKHSAKISGKNVMFPAVGSIINEFSLMLHF